MQQFDELLPRTNFVRSRDIRRALSGATDNEFRSLLDRGLLPPPVVRLSHKTKLFDRAQVLAALEALVVKGGSQ